MSDRRRVIPGEDRSRIDALIKALDDLGDCTDRVNARLDVVAAKLYDFHVTAWPDDDGRNICLHVFGNDEPLLSYDFGELLFDCIVNREPEKSVHVAAWLRALADDIEKEGSTRNGKMDLNRDR